MTSSANSTPLVLLENVRKRYDPAGPWVLNHVTLEIPTGEALAVIGPSGSGKSTLLNLVAALDAPTDGRVLFDGQNPADLSAKSLARLRNREIGFIFQLHHLLPQCTAWENVLIPTVVSEQRDGATDRAMALLERVDLADKADSRPGELSGGERQRVAVARALINEPRLLLADEPTGSLDAETAENIAELLAELHRERGMTMVVVTHSLNLANHMGRILELRDGVLESWEQIA
jgi:ABC-type lipoprotein export system ATPase subunit